MAYNPQNWRGRQDRVRESKKRGGMAPTPRSRKKEEDAVVVAITSGKPYAEALKEIKEAIRTDEIGIKVNSVRRTRNGELLLTVDKGPTGGENLKEEILSKLGTHGYTARTGRRERMVLHIKGMDAATTSADVKTAIMDALCVPDPEIKLGEMRPAFGERQNITVEVDKIMGQRLLNLETLRIGWATCKIVARVQITRCLKCWVIGHRTSECRAGVDRTKACLKCAQDGHQAKECKNEAFCPICNTSGHRADTTACNVFTSAIDSATRETSRRTPTHRRLLSVDVERPMDHIRTGAILGDRNGETADVAAGEGVATPTPTVLMEEEVDMTDRLPSRSTASGPCDLSGRADLGGQVITQND